MEYVIASLIVLHLASVYTVFHKLITDRVIYVDQLKDHLPLSILVVVTLSLLAPIFVIVYTLELIITKGFQWR